MNETEARNIANSEGNQSDFTNEHGDICFMKDSAHFPRFYAYKWAIKKGNNDFFFMTKDWQLHEGIRP